MSPLLTPTLPMLPIEPPALPPAQPATVQWQVRLLGSLQARRGTTMLRRLEIVT